MCLLFRCRREGRENVWESFCFSRSFQVLHLSFTFQGSRLVMGERKSALNDQLVEISDLKLKEKSDPAFD